MVRGVQDKLLYLVLFYLYPSLFWELRYKLKKLEILTHVGAMLEYCENKVSADQYHYMTILWA